MTTGQPVLHCHPLWPFSMSQQCAATRVTTVHCLAFVLTPMEYGKTILLGYLQLLQVESTNLSLLLFMMRICILLSHEISCLPFEMSSVMKMSCLLEQHSSTGAHGLVRVTQSMGTYESFLLGMLS